MGRELKECEDIALMGDAKTLEPFLFAGVRYDNLEEADLSMKTPGPNSDQYLTNARLSNENKSNDENQNAFEFNGTPKYPSLRGLFRDQTPIMNRCSYITNPNKTQSDPFANQRAFVM